MVDRCEEYLDALTQMIDDWENNKLKSASPGFVAATSWYIPSVSIGNSESGFFPHDFRLLMEEKTSGLGPNEVFMITPQEIEHDQEHLIAGGISKDVIAPHGSFDSTYIQVITMLLDFYEKHHQKPDDNKKQV